MHNRPVVSVIMSVYNGERCLRSAVDSILNQSFQDFEFIIVDDTSTDGTLEILKKYKDKRIRILCNQSNIGLTKSLNRALKCSLGKYIARMDCDDISFLERLEQQVEFLETHQEIYLISCCYREFGERFYRNQFHLSETEIKAQYLFGSVLPHPGFMFRRELIEKHQILYDPQMVYAQDYDFQVRVSQQFHIACLPQILLYYRVSSKQISKIKAEEQRHCADMVRYRVFERYGIPCTKRQMAVFSKVCYGEKLTTPQEYILFFRLALSVYRTLHKGKYPESPYIIAKMSEYIRVIFELDIKMCPTIMRHPGCKLFQ